MLITAADHTAFDTAAATLAAGGKWLVLALQIIAALVIAIGVILTLVAVSRSLAKGGTRLESKRLILAHYLTWALEFQLAADIADTAMTPDWQKVGQVAAIAAIRTGLTWGIGREVRAERDVRPTHET